MKNLMKTLSIITVFSLLLVGMSSAVGVGANGNTNVNTSLVRDVTVGNAPIVKVKWEMNGPFVSLSGTDDDDASGAQFTPPGVWNAKKNISFCAIVTDPDGVDDINAVYADIYYPLTTAFHPMGTPADVIAGGNPILEPNPIEAPDYGVNGCGLPVGDEIGLTKLSKDNGIALFCNTIRTTNEDLPTFYSPYNYDEICNADGELQKETAYVYCGDREITWEDPAGLYDVDVFAQDKTAIDSNILRNQFEYLPLTSYEVDFTSVNYGNVKLNTHKKISGDLTFGSADKPTVRNLGNTRLRMNVNQTDMGLGTTNGLSNVKFDARVGNNELDWVDYNPATTTWLEDLLDLSQFEEMDFSILVTKFPNPVGPWTGTMTLGAEQADFRVCEDE
ncbi:MAG: hypothetical protein V1712_00170 [Patescibacteria group bacterium]